MKQLLLVSLATAAVIIVGFFCTLEVTRSFPLALAMFGIMFTTVCIGIEIGILIQKEKETP